MPTERTDADPTPRPPVDDDRRTGSVDLPTVEGTEPRALEVEAHPPFPQVLYPQTYVWYVFVSALDVMFTAIVLHDPYGVEVNPVAAYVIERWDLAGASIYKFLLVVLVVLICEFIGRQRPATGRLLARLAVAVACVPVVVASMQLLGAVAG